MFLYKQTSSLIHQQTQQLHQCLAFLKERLCFLIVFTIEAFFIKWQFTTFEYFPLNTKVLGLSEDTYPDLAKWRNILATLDPYSVVPATNSFSQLRDYLVFSWTLSQVLHSLWILHYSASPNTLVSCRRNHFLINGCELYLLTKLLYFP